MPSTEIMFSLSKLNKPCERNLNLVTLPFRTRSLLAEEANVGIKLKVY